MSTRYNMELPDQLNSDFTAVAAEAELTKAEIMRKALQLYIVTHRAVRNGDKVGIVDKARASELKTEFVGL